MDVGWSSKAAVARSLVCGQDLPLGDDLTELREFLFQGTVLANEHKNQE